jgi:hypothetical protein
MEKINLTSYLAGAIEAANNTEMTSWRNELKAKLNSPDLVFYDPVEREQQKTGRPSGEQVKLIQNLKQGGAWYQFKKEMNLIWFGNIKPDSGHIPDIFTFLRTRKMVDGNENRDLNYFADWEAVLRSDFGVANIKKDVQTIGTIGEIFVSYLFKIPIYLIIDVPKTQCNSTLLHWVLESGGEVFYTLKECSDFIKEKYHIK